jgi:hypothetical protein
VLSQRLGSEIGAGWEKQKELLKGVVSDLIEGLGLGDRHIETSDERLQLSNEFQSELNHLLSAFLPHQEGHQ